MEFLYVVNWAFVFYVSEWAIRLVMLFYVPQRRNPGAARTWLLFIFVMPWIGLLIYAILGRAHLTRRRMELHEKVSTFIKTIGKDFFTPHSTNPHFPEELVQAIQLAKNLGDFPIVEGNQFELLPSYHGSIDRLVADIAASRHHVHLLYYLVGDDNTGNRVANALIQAVKRGVHCRVLIDSLGSKRARRRLVPKMRAGGIEVLELLPVRFFHPNSWRMDLRNHRKLAVIDAQIGYVGSQNLVDANFKEGITFEELVLRVTGPVVLELQAVFLADRYFEREAVLSDPGLFPAPERTGTMSGQLLPSGPGYPQANTLRLIVALVHGARQRVVITTPYFIPDEALLLAMETAVMRGVEVHLVLSAKADQILVGLAQRSFYGGLLRAGVHIHLYKKRFLHAKHLSIDDSIVLIGSSNMDIRSFTLNAEISMIVYDKQIAAELRAIQERYFAKAERLNLEKWQKRWFLAKLLQNTARLVDSLL